MDVHKVFTSYKDVGEEVISIIDGLKNICEIKMNDKIKNEVMKKILLLKEAFQLDYTRIIHTKDKRYSDGNTVTTANQDELESELECMSNDIIVLQKQVNSDCNVASDDIESLLTTRRNKDSHFIIQSENCHGNDNNNKKIKTTALKMSRHGSNNNIKAPIYDGCLNESFHLSDSDEEPCALDDNLRHEVDDGYNGDSSVNLNSSRVAMEECRAINEPVSVEHRASNENHFSDLDPSIFSESFFQDETAFDKCAEALSSIEYNTEVMIDETSQETVSVSRRKVQNSPHWSSSTNQITSSDELYIEACKPIEKLNLQMDLKNNCNKNYSGVSFVNNSTIQLPEINITLSSDTSSKISKDLAMTSSTSRSIQGQVKVERSSDTEVQTSPKLSIGTTRADIPLSCSGRDVVDRDIDGKTTVVGVVDKNAIHDDNFVDKNAIHGDNVVDKMIIHDDNVVTRFNTTSENMSGRTMNDSIQDLKSSNHSEGSFMLPTHLQKPKWLLTVSERMTMNQNSMSKVKTFADALNCRLSGNFNILTTHFIVYKGEKSRRIDFYEALASNKHVVTLDWVSESLREGKLLDYESFLIGKKINSIDEEDFHENSLIMNSFHVGCIVSPSQFSEDDLRRLIEMCGGTYVRDPAFFKLSRKWRNILLVEKDEFDENYEHHYRRAKENSGKFEVLDKDWLLESICEGKPLDTSNFCCEIPSPEEF